MKNKLIIFMLVGLSALFATACNPEEEAAVIRYYAEHVTQEESMPEETTTTYDIGTAPELPEVTTTVETTIPEVTSEQKPLVTVTTNCINESTFTLSGFAPGLTLYLGLNNQPALDVVTKADGTYTQWMRGGPIVNNTIYWTVSTPDGVFYAHGEVPCS